MGFLLWLEWKFARSYPVNQPSHIKPYIGRGCVRFPLHPGTAMATSGFEAFPYSIRPQCKVSLTGVSHKNQQPIQAI